MCRKLDAGRHLVNKDGKISKNRNKHATKSEVRKREEIRAACVLTNRVVTHSTLNVRLGR